MRYVLKRGNWFHFKRRIPVLYSSYYDDEFIQVSLKTDSEKTASQRATILNKELESIWDQLSPNGQSNPDENAFDQAVLIARMNGFNYRPAEEVADQGLGRIVSRVSSIKDHVRDEPEKVEAILGKHPRPELNISKAMNSYFDFEAPNQLNKSPNQVRKWKNPRRKAVKNFIDVCGDKDVSAITRDDILDFREWWHNRLQAEGLTANSSNKDFTYINQILSFAKDDKRLDIDVANLMARVRFTETASTRPPFPTEFIKDELLNLQNLMQLNEECRWFLFAMADTGARPSELLGLTASKGDIRLDTEIPYIFIQPHEGKELKTPQSKRQIPLTGASLLAFKKIPEGFNRYYRKADLLSSTLNKYLKENNLLPTSEHCLYSLRHSFEDRLTAVEPPDKVQAALMGHKYDRPRYGDGPTLEQKKKWLEKICFNVEGRA